MEKLNKDFKQAWIAALRSGEYKQERGQLCKATGHYSGYQYAFCCLGVAAVVAGIPKQKLIGVGMPYLLKEERYSMPVQLFTEPDEDEVIATLINMNDGVGRCDRQYTFVEIADYIEENL